MEGAEKDDRASPPLQIDPKCLQDALRTFFQPIKTGDSRVDFYTIYKKEATDYDTDYVKKYDEDLNTTLIFAGLFSAVSSAFVIDVHSNLQPNPNQQSAALLRAILLTLNQSAIPGETPTVPPAQQPPPSEIVTVTCLMYASLLISLLAAFVAMLGKQWLNRYLRNSGGSTIERCGDRQRKFDGLEKWPFHSFVESLPLMLQTALLLLACGLCKHMWSINALVARTLISLTGLGVVFYIGIVIAGMSSYACPFQTPTSIALHGPWKKVRHGITFSIVRSKRVLSRAHRMWKRRVRWLLRHQFLPTIPLEGIQVQRSESVSASDNTSQPESLSTSDNTSQSESLSTLDSDSRPETWSDPKGLDIIHRTNTSDARCVSWILRNITDPEALDAALPLAGEIRWFDDGVDVNSPYDLIASTFKACFDSTGVLYPGSRDRAYYSGRAMAWIRTLAMCKSEELASTFPLPIQGCTTPVPDPDLEHLLYATYEPSDPYSCMERLLRIDPCHTHLHSQWISNLLLYYSWANQTTLLNFEDLLSYLYRACGTETTTPLPLNVTLNRLLMWCILLGLPVKEEVLRVQVKSNYMEPILDQLSKAVHLAMNDTRQAHKRFIQCMLGDLIKLENRPECLTKIAYEWCSVICKNRDRFEDWERLLHICLEIGFRHLNFGSPSAKTSITHTEHHRGLVDVVFKTQETEVIADLLHAWTTRNMSRGLGHELLSSCVGHLVGLHNLVPFSPRLRRLVIRSVELIGYGGFEGVGVKRFVELLNHLHVTIEDVVNAHSWARLLSDTIQSSEGIQHLSHSYWGLLVEPEVLDSWVTLDPTRSLQTIKYLTETKEWSKLECWMGFVWVMGSGGMTEEDLERSTVLLSRQRPGALQKLKQRMEQWSQYTYSSIPESFQRICEQAHEAAQQETTPVSSTVELEETAELACSSPPRGDKFWESLAYYVS